MEDFIIQVLEAAAWAIIARADLGREMDAGFDAGEFSGGSRPGEEEAHDFLFVLYGPNLGLEGEWETDYEQEAWEAEATF
jgi:hypothetical protein